MYHRAFLAVLVFVLQKTLLPPLPQMLVCKLTLLATLVATFYLKTSRAAFSLYISEDHLKSYYNNTEYAESVEGEGLEIVYLLSDFHNSGGCQSLHQDLLCKSVCSLRSNGYLCIYTCLYIRTCYILAL